MFFSVFLGFGYFYLNKNITDVNQNTEKIPYEQTLTENKGILLTINGRQTFVYLDFIESKTVVSLSPQTGENNIYGYPCDYTVIGSDELIIKIIDNVGGIELKQNGAYLRFTGLQVCEVLKRSNSNDLRKEVITAVCQNIVKYGVNKAFFTDVINNSKTNLNVTDCFFWDKHLGKVCMQLNFID